MDAAHVNVRLVAEACHLFLLPEISTDSCVFQVTRYGMPVILRGHGAEGGEKVQGGFVVHGCIHGLFSGVRFIGKNGRALVFRRQMMRAIPGGGSFSR